MATSRYVIPGNNADQGRVTNTQQNQGGTTVTNQQGTNQSTTNQNQLQRTNQSTTTNTRSQNMSNASLAALERLIAQLMGGGTQQMAQERANRTQQTNETRSLQAQYSKPAAFADAQGAMAQATRRAMESQIPALTRAADSAGTSGGSMRALLTQDAVNKAAESASALGLKASVDYGSISTNLANTLEVLTRPDTTQISALLNALQVAKGAVTSSSSQSNTSGTTSTTGTSSTTGSTTQTGVTQQQQQTNQNQQTQPIVIPSNYGSPVQVANPVTNQVGAMQVGQSAFTAQQDALLRNLGTTSANNSNTSENRWSSYSF